MASKPTQQGNNCSIDLCRRPPKRPQKKRSLLSVVDDNDENEHHQQQEQHVETTTRTMQADNVADSCNETRKLLSTTARRKIPFDKNTTTTTLTGSSLPPRSTHNHDNNADAVPQRLQQQQHQETTAGVASRQDDDFFLVHCRKIQALSTTTPNAQLRAYWKLVYGDDTPQPIQKKTNTTCQQQQPHRPLRSVLKRPNNKRSRHGGGGGTELSLSSTTLQDGSFDSPQHQQQQSANAYSYWTPQAPPPRPMMIPTTATTTRCRVVQFGPSSGVSFAAGTPVAGGLQPLSAADVPTGEGSDNDDDDEALRETKANAAVLAAWEAMEQEQQQQHDDQDEEETSRRRNDKDTTTTTTLGHRPARRSSTLFSPHSKNLLRESPPVNRDDDDEEEEEDSDDANDESEPQSNHDPVNKLLLSALQVHSPTLGLHGDDDGEEKVSTSLSDTTIILKVSPSESSKQGEGNQEAPSDVVDATVQSPKKHLSVPFSNENVSPNACYGNDDASWTEPEPFCWQQLLPKRQSPAEWMEYYQTSHPLRMLLAQALSACADKLHRGKVGCLYEPSLACTRRDVAEVKLMQDLCQQLETRQQSMLVPQGEKLKEAWREAFSILQSPLLLQIARLESDIAVLENAIAREAKALALSRQRKLTLSLKFCQRQEVEWTALSSLLSGNVDFPREDEAGLVYAFPVKKLACEVILRPNDHGALGIANLNVTAGLATTDIPLEMAESFRRIISIKLVEMCQEQDYDFQQASRQVIVFLGRLDRILDDLLCACRQWEHGLVRNLDDKNVVSLQFQVTHTTRARLIWQITPLEPLVLEYAYPNRVELVQENGSSIVDSNRCDPPCLRSLWRTVAVHVNSNSVR